MTMQQKKKNNHNDQPAIRQLSNTECNIIPSIAFASLCCFLMCFMISLFFFADTEILFKKKVYECEYVK